MFNFLIFLTLSNAADLTNKGEYEASQTILKTIQPKSVDYTKYCFYRATNAFCLNQKEEAEKWIQYLLDNFETYGLNKHARYVHLAQLMQSELKEWKSNDIADVGRDMRISASRLENAKGGKKTQEVQEQIVKKLDKLIKEQEDAMNGKGDGSGNPDKDGAGKGNNPSNPQSESLPGGSSGKGDIIDKKLNKLAEEWGKMPPKERAAAIQEITRELPPKFRPMIEEYYRSLNKIHDK